ncbi:MULTISPECIES: DUF5710 domain-containing protein [Furfurilactobacillus]|uniref:DUF5710 domain-containing protein n=1 Tax=Furfurilactobacillus rossiae TaxID=231049 RepID=A0A7C9N6S2_9LACO|nr:DUF5710 domain-containing protein [Furfurilactobacillus milii]MYV06449.1 hypothetical protein [Furfurilactobacillus milii]
MADERYLRLNVPYADKEEVKSLFARWNHNEKFWYATNPKYYYRFAKWINTDVVITNSLGIVSAKMECWRCGEKTMVSGVGIQHNNMIFVTERLDLLNDFGIDLMIIPWSSAEKFIPTQLVQHAESNYHIKAAYSQAVNSTYLANTCSNCGALQGDHFVYGLTEEPLGINSEQELFLEEIPLLKGDLPILFEPNVQASPQTNLLSHTEVIRSKFSLTDYTIPQ